MAFAGIVRPLGLLGLLALIPFIILYLRKQKPIQQVVPSLMFLVKEQQKSKRYSFFSKLFANLIFYFQLAAILMLGISVAAPFVTLPYDTTKENTVIVIDVSASMQTKDANGITRFAKALAEAKKAVSGRTSIILAENAPLIALEDEEPEIALEILSKLKPKATATNIGDALLLAKDILGERSGRIVVASDFASNQGPDVQVVKTALSADNRIIDFIDVSAPAANVGIIRLDTNKYKTKIYIQNFNTQPKTIMLTVNVDGKSVAKSEQITIAPRSIEPFDFQTPAAAATIELTPHDDLTIDDYGYIAPPPKTFSTVLLVTNKENSNLELALLSAKDIRLNVVNPPVLTINTKKEKIDPFGHDVIIVSGINNVNQKDGILPGTFSDFSQYVERGGNLIITAQSNLKEIDTKGLLLVELKNLFNKPVKACVDIINQVTKPFESQHCFATVSTYYAATPKKEAITFASSADQNPLVVFSPHKKGKIIYYGIIDEASDFQTVPAYPVFWDNLINFLVETKDIRDFNFNTGKIMVTAEQQITGPSSTYTAAKVLMDESGFYQMDGKKYAANLLDQAESDVTAANIEQETVRQLLTQKETRMHDFNLEVVLGLLAFIVLLLELAIIKFRGEL